MSRSRDLANLGDEATGGLVKADIGLGNVDNTSDANKPVSTATQTALDAKLAVTTASSTYAPLASPDFTGTVDLTGTTISLDNDQISGDKISGGTISNFSSTGIDDNASSNALTIESSGNTAFSGTVDLQGNELILDADNDTSIHANNDDRIDFKTQGSDRLQISSTGNLILSGGCPIHAENVRNSGTSVSTSYVTLLDFSNLAGGSDSMGFYLVTVVRNPSFGTNGIFLVGASTSEAYIYHTIRISAELQAQTSGTNFQIKTSSSTYTIHATAIPIGINGSD